MAERASQSPQLVSTLTGCNGTVNGAVLVEHDDAIITVSSDKMLRVWAKRSSGHYWPTICHGMGGQCSAVVYSGESRKILVGLTNGQIYEFELSEDVNRITPKRSYNAHSRGVTCVRFVPGARNWLLSTGKDKTFQWYCTSSGRRMGSYDAGAWCTCVEFDSESSYAFVADYSGKINILHLKQDGCTHMTTLRGHQNSVRALCWDQERRMLFSGGFDQLVVIWDIGSRQGVAYELFGHKDVVNALAFSARYGKLVSSSEDSVVGVWDMGVDRKETPEWTTSNVCEKCGGPFFWNIKGMWTMKKFGWRQHHCRKCGRALCHSCSSSLSTLPAMGYEVPVRMCKECNDSISTDDRSPMAYFTNLHPPVRHLTINDGRNLVVAVHTDDSVRLWSLGELVQ